MPVTCRNDHDLTLPAWGPYSKSEFGISHIASHDEGLRFDISVVPGRFRGEFFTPDAIRPSGWAPWDAASGLCRYAYRQQIVWKDQVYAHVDLTPQAQGARVDIELVNNTALTECLCLHLCARMTSPNRTGTREPLRSVRALLPESASWTCATAYTAINLPETTPYSGLNYDAAISGETAGDGFTGGYGLGKGFGTAPQHQVTYSVPAGSREALLRWRAQGGDASRIVIEIEGHSETGGHSELPSGHTALADVPVGEFCTYTLPLPEKAATVTIRCENGQPLQIDGIAFGSEGFAPQVRFQPTQELLVPELTRAPQQAALLYGTHHYTIQWEEPRAWIREIRCNEIANGLLRALHNHVSDCIDLGEQGHLTDIFFGPLDVPAHSSHKLSFHITYADASAQGDSTKPSTTEPLAAQHNYTQHSHTPDNPAPEDIRFGRDRLRAVVMTNAVFPIRAKGHWIRHFTPGRWWDSLYTWDSGCIGLGLATADLQRSTDNLLAYLCEPGDAQAAFVHHGSMVPTQFYQAQDIWNKTQDKALLAHLWPRLEQYFRYFIGQLEGSTMSPFASQLLAPWDYFYNSGGWDDYPPQHYLSSRPQQRRHYSPAITNALAIRCAKIMAGFAEVLDTDPAPYLCEAERITKALQQHGWDEQSGFFGYVAHDEHGQPQGFLRDDNGHFFNRGMDGLTPLLAGATTPAQTERMWATLLDPQRFLTPLGMSAVDMQAPYFDKGGYWNGSVWLPYQWFFWKAMLDYGLTDAAHRLALSVLASYGAETRNRYFCWEHFMIESGRGAGWHHFGGLSSPVLNLFESYYTPGSISGGHDCFILERRWNADHTRCTVKARQLARDNATASAVAAAASSASDAANSAKDAPIRADAAAPANGAAAANNATQHTTRGLLITMKAGPQYSVRINGQSVAHSSPVEGCLCLTHDFGTEAFVVEVEAV